YQLGLDALETRNARKAHRIADKLAALHNTAAYEIGARAHWMVGDHDKAIQLLQVGVSKFPHVAILWYFLGEFLSDMTRYEEAIEAFEKSADGHGGSRGRAVFNIALVHWRKGNYSRALEILNQIDPNMPRHRVLELRGTVLVDLKRYEEAQGVLEELATSRPKEVTATELSLMLGLMAETELGLADLEQARYYAKKCVELDRNQVRGLRVLRELGD
ncbi:MAG TPA: CDC27 family protein, partial [Fimbriimonadaceae bacterium]|nr:CDC27 family protein [Fimbriimonadaceae bacterium]